MTRTILVCLDGSSLAEQILPHVTEMALQYSNKVILLRVVPAKVEVATGVSKQTPLSVEERVDDYLEGVAASLAATGVEVEYAVVLGKPGESIVSYARENKVDLIAMATHGRSGLRSTLFGSVAEHVLRESGMAVLLVRPKHESSARA